MTNKKKKWTTSKKLMLYKLVEQYGYRWTIISKILESTPGIVRGKYRHTKWPLLFSKNKGLKKEILSNDNLDKIAKEKIDPIIAEDKAQEMIDKEKQRIITIHEKKRAQEILKNIAAQDIIYEKLESAIISLPPIKTQSIKLPDNDNLKTRPEEAVLIISDMHLGLAVKSEEIGGLTEYNENIFIKRLDSLINKVVRITKRHRKSCKIETLNLFFLGDNVHGSNNAGQWGFLHTSQTVVDQLFLLWEEVEKAILKLKMVFPKIKIHCVYGNHGRIAKRGYEKNFVNWDFVLYNILQKTLKKQKNISWSIPRAPFDIANVCGYKFLLVHGDQVRSWSGIPFYGMIRAESKFRSLFDRNVDVKKIHEEAINLGITELSFKEQMEFVYNRVKNFDYMCMAHFHHMAELETNSGGRIIMNSSFSGGDDYSINNLLVANTPSQKFFGVHPQGKSWSYDIFLDRE